MCVVRVRWSGGERLRRGRRREGEREMERGRGKGNRERREKEGEERKRGRGRERGRERERAEREGVRRNREGRWSIPFCLRDHIVNATNVAVKVDGYNH